MRSTRSASCPRAGPGIPEEVSIAWQIDAYRFEMPLVVAPMDSVVSPATAIAVGQLGGLAALDLEGLWTRYEDPEPLLAEAAELDDDAATRRLQQIYAEPIKEDLIGRRIEEIRAAGVTTAARLSPQRTVRYYKAVIDAGVDIFVIRGTTVSAEHVSGQAEPLNLKQFIYELDVPVIVGGCATHTAALHLMRTGAAGVLAGFGGGSGHTTAAVLGVAVPMATAIADVAAARRDYLDESGGRYVHVIADGGMTRSGDIAKALALGADAVMVGSPFARRAQAPGRGYHWGSEAHHPDLPRGGRLKVGTIGTLEQILHGPVHGLRRVDEPDGRAAPHHGHVRLLRPQGVPAGGSRGDAECHAALTSGSGPAPGSGGQQAGNGQAGGSDPALAHTRLGPAERAAALDALAGTELQVLVVGGGVVGAGCRPGCGHQGPDDRPGRGQGLRLGHVVAVEQADPRRPALPGAAQRRPGARGAGRAVAAAPAARAASGAAGLLPVPVHPSRLGAGLRGRGRHRLRHARLLHGPDQGTARPPSADQERRAAAGARRSTGRP